jgi:DNA damage-inducible protein 1
VNPQLRASVSRDVELSSAASADTAGPLRDLFLRRSMDSALPDVNHFVALRDAEMRLLRNPLDTDAQRVLESEITRQNVAANRELAMDVMPESFIRLDMLRVRLSVHGVDCVGMIDTGAQMTIISNRTAIKCGIMRLVDTRESGIASGVGTGKIVGKVHAVDIKLGGEGITASFTVMEKDDMEFLIGLDLLRRFGAIVDLPRNVLVLNLGSKKIEVPFLTSVELAALPESPRSASASAGGGGPLAGEQPARVSMPSPPVPSSSPTVTGLPLFNLSGILPPASSSDVNALMAAGFSREVAISALKASGGDVDSALARLLEEH